MLDLDIANLFAFCDLHASRVQVGWAPDVRYYDRQGFPIPNTLDEPEYGAALGWAKLHADPDYRILAHDDLPDGGLLSTVWLGLDHGFHGPPRFFETMRFSGEQEPLEIMGRTRMHHPSREFPDPRTGEMVDQLRYGSEEEALAVHHGILGILRRQLGS